MSTAVDFVAQYGLGKDEESLNILIVSIIYKWKEGPSGVAKVLAYREPAKDSALTAENVRQIFGQLQKEHSKIYTKWFNAYQKDPLGTSNEEMVEITRDVAEDFRRASKA